MTAAATCESQKLVTVWGVRQSSVDPSGGRSMVAPSVDSWIGGIDPGCGNADSGILLMSQFPGGSCASDANQAL
jgi:hypothetical protein